MTCANHCLAFGRWPCSVKRYKSLGFSVPRVIGDAQKGRLALALAIDLRLAYFLCLVRLIYIYPSLSPLSSVFRHLSCAFTFFTYPNPSTLTSIPIPLLIYRDLIIVITSQEFQPGRTLEASGSSSLICHTILNRQHGSRRRRRPVLPGRGQADQGVVERFAMEVHSQAFHGRADRFQEGQFAHSVPKQQHG